MKILIETKISNFTIALQSKNGRLKKPYLKKKMISQTNFLRLKKYPTNFLFQEIFRLDVNYMNPIKLPIFPKELYMDSSQLHKGLEKISDFAVSKYLIQDLTSIKPKNIFKNILSTPNKIFTIISESKSSYFTKND